MHWGPQDPVHTNPVIFETDNVATRIRVDVVLQCSYQDFVHWGPQARRKAKRGS